MPDLTSPKLIHLKGWLFLLIGLTSAGLLIAETMRWKVAALLALCVWGFCRFYDYAFYVIERYVDPGYRFAGLGAFVRYWMRRPR